MGIGTIKIKQHELAKARMLLKEHPEIKGEIIGDYFVKIEGRNGIIKFMGLIDKWESRQKKPRRSIILLIPSDKCASDKTRLKDKFGKNIYVGDVVEWDDAEGRRTAVVIKENGKIAFYCFKNSRPNWAVGHKFFLDTYLKEQQVHKLLEGIEKKARSKVNVLQNENSSSITLCARDYKTPKVVQIDSSGKGFNSQNDRIYNAESYMCCLPSHTGGDKLKIFALRSRTEDNKDWYNKEHFLNPEFRDDGCSNSLTSVQKENLVMNCITEAQGRQGSSSEFLDACRKIMVNLQLREGKGIGGKGVIWKEDGTSYCVYSNNGQAFIDCYNKKIKDISPSLTEPNHNSLRCFDFGIFRRLTPKECFRLQGFLKDEINLNGLSDTQCYKLAGNGQSVNVVSKILKELLI